MDWHFLGTRPDLTRWTLRPFSAGVAAGPRATDNRDNHEREVGQEPPGPPLADGPFRRLAQAIFAFDIFGSIAAAAILKEPIAINDTVGLSYRLLPGCRIFFAARTYERFDCESNGTWRTGFSYRTLQGHPMCGEETFCVEKDIATGRIVVALRSWSRPAHWTTKLGYPLARRWQLQAARAALDHLQSMASAK